jgi:outer membrane protein assembly factor BamB
MSGNSFLSSSNTSTSITSSSLTLSSILTSTYATTSTFTIPSTSIFTSSSYSTSSTSSSDSVSFSGDWLTYHNGNNRSGYTGSNPLLNSPSVNWTSKVSGAVYAEPLVYDGAVYIATEDNNVYALKAATGALLWSVHLGTPVDSLKAPYRCDGGNRGPDITPTIGVTGTPVIDPVSGTIYVASLINNTGFLLFALSTSTGVQRWNAIITASGFNYLPEEERGALALANGFVYVPFGGYSYNCFNSYPIGWVIAMSANGRGEQHSFSVPTEIEGDIWEPEGVTVNSAGNVYVVSGDSDNASFDYGNSVMMLTPDLTFTNSTNNYFAAADWQYTNENDLDQGTTGATLLTNSLLFSIGKDGVGYLLNETHLGGIGGQLYSAAVCGSVDKGWPFGAWGSTSFYNNTIYVPCAASLDALSLKTGAHPTFTSLWNFTGIWAGPPIIAGGAVWTVSITGGTLYALNLKNGAVLYQVSAGTVEHFTTPSAGDGMVFLGANQTIYAINS